jgi:hypothetical protein
MMIGCKSVAVRGNGTLEPHMTLNCALMAKAPFLAGCLWTIGDKDSDRQMKYILEESISLVTQARKSFDIAKRRSEIEGTNKPKQDALKTLDLERRILQI